MSELPSPATPAEPEKRPQPRRASWEFGVILIFIGGFILLQRTTDLRITNWWAFFILLPAFGSLNRAWERYEAQDRKITRRVIESFMAGVFFVALSAIFLFNLDWWTVLPVLLIIFGLGMLLSAVAGRGEG